MYLEEEDPDFGFGEVHRQPLAVLVVRRLTPSGRNPQKGAKMMAFKIHPKKILKPTRSPASTTATPGSVKR